MSSKAVNKKALIIVLTVLLVIAIALAIVLPIVLKKTPETPNNPNTPNAKDLYEITDIQIGSFNKVLGGALGIKVDKIGLSQAEYEAAIPEGSEDEYEPWIFYKLKSDMATELTSAIKKAKMLSSAYTEFTSIIADATEEISFAISELLKESDDAEYKTSFTQIYLEVQKFMSFFQVSFQRVENANISDAMIGDIMYYFMDGVYDVIYKNAYDINLYMFELQYDQSEKITDVDTLIMKLSIEFMPTVQSLYREVGIDAVSEYYELYFSMIKKVTSVNNSMITNFAKIYEGKILYSDYEVLLGMLQREFKSISDANDKLFVISGEFNDMLKIASSHASTVLSLMGVNGDFALVLPGIVANSEKLVNDTYKGMMKVLEILKSEKSMNLLSRDEILITKNLYTDDEGYKNAENYSTDPLKLSAFEKIYNDRTILFSKIMSAVMGNNKSVIAIINAFSRCGLVVENIDGVWVDQTKETIDSVNLFYAQLAEIAALDYGTIIVKTYYYYENGYYDFSNSNLVYKFKAISDKGQNDIIIYEIIELLYESNYLFADQEINTSISEIKGILNLLINVNTFALTLPISSAFVLPTMGYIAYDWGFAQTDAKFDINEFIAKIFKFISIIPATPEIAA